MKGIDEKTLALLVRSIVQIADPVQVVLFGSTARREVVADSDLDILVVVPGRFNKSRCRSDLYADIMARLRKFELPLDLLIFTRSEVKQWRSSTNHVICRALREGKVLYEKRKARESSSVKSLR